MLPSKAVEFDSFHGLIQRVAKVLKVVEGRSAQTQPFGLHPRSFNAMVV